MSITDRIASLEPDTFMGDSWQDGYYAAIEDVLKLMANDAVTQRVDYCAEYGDDQCDIHLAYSLCTCAIEASPCPTCRKRGAANTQ